jgi:hypothetical protein
MGDSNFQELQQEINPVEEEEKKEKKEKCGQHVDIDNSNLKKAVNYLNTVYDTDFSLEN